MAEFCKECFLREIAVLSDNLKDEDLILSEDNYLCESCEQFKQIVVEVIQK